MKEKITLDDIQKALEEMPHWHNYPRGKRVMYLYSWEMARCAQAFRDMGYEVQEIVFRLPTR